MTYILILAFSYVSGWLWARRQIAADQKEIRRKMKAAKADLDIVEDMLEDADRLVYSVGPAFLFGTLLGGPASLFVWVFADRIDALLSNLYAQWQ